MGDYHSTHLHTWDPDSGRRLFSPRSHGRSVSDISFHPDGLRYVTSSWAGTVKEWDVSSGHDPDVFRGHLSDAKRGRHRSVGSPWPCPEAVAASCGSGDLDTGEGVRTLPGHRRWVACVEFSPDGRFLASGDVGPEAEIHIRRASDWRLVHRLRGHEGRVTRLRFLPGSRILLSTSDDGRLIRWGRPATGCRSAR